MAITGNPKRLFISAKDRVLSPDLTVSQQAVHTGFQQIERFLNTRVVAASVIGGTNSTLFTSPTTTTAIFSLGAPDYDTGSIVDIPNNRLVIPEPGIYDIRATIILNYTAGVTGYYQFYIVKFHSNGVSFGSHLITQNPVGAGTSTPWRTPMVIQFNLSSGDYLNLQGTIVTGGTSGTDSFAFASFQLVKVADVPSKFGQ